ncbi:putative hydrolase [compost metagenome]
MPSPDELTATTELELLGQGGHVGFIGGAPHQPDYYLERRIPDWLVQRHGETE